MNKTRAFTLVELLVVIGIIAILIGILLPSLNAARQQSQSAACASNIRQLAISSMQYAQDNHSYWPPAHLFYYTQNNARWHGTRTSGSQPFDFAASPLLKYLQTASVKRCPSFDFSPAGFESACGGYGYNNHYIGSGSDEPSLQALANTLGPLQWDLQIGNVAAKLTQIRRASEKIAFADTAMGAPGQIEYSFAEPPVTVWGPNSPSIQFRHRDRANIAWADGHVTSEKFEWTYPGPNVYGADNQSMHLGWFGPKDNTLFQRQ